MARRKKKSRARLVRAANLLLLLPLAGRAPMYARLIWALALDARVPTARKALLVLAGAYVVSPIDLIPESVPIVGAIDDLAVLVLAVDAFFDGLPPELIAEKLEQLGIDRAELDTDLARVRRIVPKPVRAAVAALPGVIDSVGRYVGDLVGRYVDSREELSA